MAGGIAALAVLMEKLLHLHFNGLLQNLLSTATHHNIEELATLKLRAEVGDFHIDLFLWKPVAESRSLVHWRILPALVGPAEEKNFQSLSRIRRFFLLS